MNAGSHRVERNDAKKGKAGRQDGESERHRIVEEARQEADKIIAQTKAELDAASEKARRELRREIGGLSVELAERILSREVRPEDNGRLIDDFVAQLNSGQKKN